MEFDSPQVKNNLIESKKDFMYQLPYELRNDLLLRLKVRW